MNSNGVNMVLGVELNLPSAVALDARGGQVHIYISDTRNFRVLAWQDARSYQVGDPPALVLGQPGPQYSKPQGIGVKGFASPLGLAVDPVTGNLFVADFGNNRVLRFPSPFANLTRAEPDAVYGQPDFTTNAAGTTPALLSSPQSVAVDAAGNLWVADSGNHRVLRFGAATLNNPTPPPADTVIGQSDMFSGSANRGGSALTASGFNTPIGLAFDAQGNLYVADFNNTRVLKFAAPLGPNVPNPAAAMVIGEPDFASRGVPLQASNATLAGPVGVAVDNAGNLYVAVPNDNRVLIFASGAHAAQNVLGQSDFSTTTANTGVAPMASPNTLSGPNDVKVDPNGNVYVVDSGNNRVLSFPASSKSATIVWGQSTFSANGPNEVKPGSLNVPFAIAIDYSQAPYALYISDTANNRILGWKDSVRFRSGDPADLVIGQPDLLTALPNVDSHGSPNPSATSLSGPTGIAVQPNTGILYVADSGNNRVLRFPRPVNQTGRITPDAVIGQTNFTSSVSAVVNASSLRGPAGLAFGPDGDLFVADGGNSRVLEFASGAGSQASAVRVYGQPSFTSSVASTQVSAQTLTTPQGVFVDSAFNLYVADSGANRVVIFPNTQAAPPTGMAAAFVIGQARFDTTAGGSGTTLHTPTSVAVDSAGDIFVSDSNNNRVLEFPSLVFLPVENASASAAIGQPSINGNTANWDSSNGLATADGLAVPVGIYLDRQDTLYVADAGNSRVVQFLKAVAAVNAASYQSSVPVPQGGLVSLFGNGIVSAGSTASAQGTPWPTSLLNRQIVVNDVTPVPLYYIGPTQVNFQYPSAAPVGSERIAIRLADTGELIAGGTILAAATSPGLFTVASTGTGQAAAVNQDNTINSSSNPAAAGSVITLYGTGQGQVSPQVLDGTPAPTNPLATTVAVPTSDAKTCTTSQPSMCVAVGSAFGNVQYSGLAPGYIGLWQINVTIPAGTTPGSAVPVRVLIDGAPSNTVTIAIH
jgi:uncharacterized protein (TIGR03437 family)